MWADLSIPWQVCLELAWEAYCDDCYPIGAVVTGPDGKILTRGRNRVYPYDAWAGRSRGVMIAHAETEALHSLEFENIDPHACALVTTSEPCPMCLGTFYMSGLRALSYACRDPFAGSVEMLGKTWYLSRKPIQVNPPFSPQLELVLLAMQAEHGWNLDKEQTGHTPVRNRWAEAIPAGIQLADHLSQTGMLRSLRAKGVSASEVINQLLNLVK